MKEMLTPLEDHQLLLFWVQLLLLLAVARGMGVLMQRIGQPPVVGELAAGLLVGPSVFGRLAPDWAQALFPGDPTQSAALLAISWIGVVFLLVTTGFETDLGLLRRLIRSTAIIPLGSLLLPLGLGLGLGLLMPEQFLAEGGRTVFALFIATALSVSALPVVARVLLDMKLMRRNIGQIIIVAAMVDDLAGWLMLSTLAGAVAGEASAAVVVLKAAAVLLFAGGALTAGQRAVDWALRATRKGRRDVGTTLTVAVLTALAFASLTQAIGIEAVFGAFVSGIVLSRSRYLHREVKDMIEKASNAVFAPIFFATAGIYVDLGTLFEPTTALWALIVIIVASVAKFGGSFIGAKFSSLSRSEGLAIGAGLNARGALEIIVALIALRIGVFNPSTYTIVVLLAMVTSVAAPPLLRRMLRDVAPPPDEAERLEHEEVMGASVLANTDAALLPAHAGHAWALTGRVVDLALKPDARVTLLTPDGTAEIERGNAAQAIKRELERSDAQSLESWEDAADAILDEAELGYGLLALGLSQDFKADRMPDLVAGVLAKTPVPVLLVRPGRQLRADTDVERLRFEKVVVAAAGTVVGQAAEEVAYLLASHSDADVHAVHVISRPDQHSAQEMDGGSAAEDSAGRLLAGSVSLSEKLGRSASTATRAGEATHEELLKASEESGADLLVLGAQVQTADSRPFLGHNVEYLVERAEQTLLVVVFPRERTH